MELWEQERTGLTEEQRNLLERWNARGIVGGTAELAGALERAGLSFKLWESLVEVLT